MAEQDNSGIPIAYLLLSTASSIEKDKRIRALDSFLRCVRDLYKIHPHFIHTDKDVAEIQAAQQVWPKAKHQLCWWHLRKAIRERLAKRKLATSPYNAARAHSLFSFIDPLWIPTVCPDPADNEGGDSDERAAVGRAPQITAPNLELLNLKTQGPNMLPLLRLPGRPPNDDPLKGVPDAAANVSGIEVKTQPQPASAESKKSDAGGGKVEELVEKRTFCPEEYRDDIVDMVEKHLCAHPLIPGDCAATPTAIYEWAVKKIYQYCAKNELVKLWAGVASSVTI